MQLVIISGPEASGKSEIGHKLAEQQDIDSIKRLDRPGTLPGMKMKPSKNSFMS
jgi:tRNA A37 N6-isopentenylltransferase MiaA